MSDIGAQCALLAKLQSLPNNEPETIVIVPKESPAFNLHYLCIFTLDILDIFLLQKGNFLTSFIFPLFIFSNAQKQIKLTEFEFKISWKVKCIQYFDQDVREMILLFNISLPLTPLSNAKSNFRNLNTKIFLCYSTCHFSIMKSSGNDGSLTQLSCSITCDLPCQGFVNVHLDEYSYFLCTIGDSLY